MAFCISAMHAIWGMAILGFEDARVKRFVIWNQLSCKAFGAGPLLSYLLHAELNCGQH